MVFDPVVHIKYAPAAWQVNEQLTVPLAGHGEHAYFYVEKCNLNTLDVARRLAGHCGVPLQQVGYAGLKDKHAVTRQWFSVPYAQDGWPSCDERGSSDSDAADADVFGEGVYMRCLQAARHTHKLRRGQHSANHFTIRLRSAEPACVPAVDRLNDWFPNYFGPQRVSAANVAMARRWLAQGVRKAQGKRRNLGRSGAGGRRGWHLSVLRSELFNAVLALRVAQGNYNVELAGDVLDHGLPTGPLWGRGRSATTGLAAAIEQEALAPHSEVCEALEFTGLQQGRRALAQRPANFAFAPVSSAPENEVELSFLLPPGAYATALLAHHFTVHDDSRVRDDSSKYERV